MKQYKIRRTASSTFHGSANNVQLADVIQYNLYVTFWSVDYCIFVVFTPLKNLTYLLK